MMNRIPQIYMKRRKGRDHPLYAGFSLLELLVTLMIMAVVLASVSGILNDIMNKTKDMQSRLSQLRIAQHSIDRLIVDMSLGSGTAKVVVERDNGMSHVIISADGDKDKELPGRIDWVSVPRYDGEDLVLFRREIKNGQGESLYVPLCENLCSFVVELYDAEGQSILDPNSPMQMVEVTAEIYIDNLRDPERVMTVRRSFCRERF